MKPAITLITLLTVLALSAGGCATRPPETRFEFQRPEMGLPFRIVLYARSESEGTEAAEAAFGRIAELNSILSDYEEQSELSKLSRSSGTGTKVPVSRDLWQVLEFGARVSAASDGAFDVTVGPYVQLWRRARRQREFPPAASLAAAKAVVGWQYLVLDPRHQTAELLRKGMKLDLGGIAKGYALDEAAAVLRKHNIRRFLVSGGGDIVAGEPPPSQKGWRVEIGVFDSTNAPKPAFIQLARYALATSGDQFQRAEIGTNRYSHIVDPRTGVGLTDHRLVSILAPKGMTADALSKVASVMEPATGLERLARFAGVEALVLRQPSESVERYETPGLKRWWW
jgi:thiamine biosynthesis lipoprotein